VEKKRVVITGLGSLTPVGNTVSDYWTALTSGKSGVSRITKFDVSNFPTQIAAHLPPFDAESVFDKKEIRRTSRFIILATMAAAEAVKDSGLDIAPIADHVGVEIGSGMGGVEILEENQRELVERGPSKVSPFAVPMMICDMASGQVAIKFGAKGPNSCSVTACASSANSMGNAFRAIQYGDAIAMITGGSEAVITPLGLACFCAARSLSRRNDEPERASRPFDAERDGFVMGEGSGILIFEEYEHAKARGAKIYAEVVGFGASGDAYHITAPAEHGEGAKRAIKMALDMAGITPADVDYINAHGTSTKLNDERETEAIKAVFGDRAYTVAISSTKSMTGHLLGAAGAIELIACCKSIETSTIHPTINYEHIDPACNLNYTPNKTIAKSIRYTLSNSFGFGGHNAVLALKNPNA
jgi:3-oxoacyl-[acyl-carrier-protein] synthase II